MFRFKFQSNNTINEEFDFFEGGGEPWGKGPLIINIYLNYY